MFFLFSTIIFVVGLRIMHDFNLTIIIFFGIICTIYIFGAAIMNVENRTLFIADNLDIMRGIDSQTVDLIYLDPPFNTNKEHKAPMDHLQRVRNLRTSGQMRMSKTGGIVKSLNNIHISIRLSKPPSIPLITL